MDHKLFMSLLSKKLYPRLRAEGFCGSGSTLRRINEPTVELLNVQGSSGADRCYLNLGVHFTFLSPEGRPPIDPSKLKEYECAFSTRIGPPDDQLGWYYGANEDEAAAMVELVVLAWDEQAKPFFARHTYPQAIGRVVDELSPSEIHPGHALKYARIAINLGKNDRALEIAQSALERVPVNATTLKHDIETFILSLRAP